MKNATSVDTSKFAKNIGLATLKIGVDKLDISKLKYVPTNLSNLNSKVGQLDVNKLVLVHADLSKLSDVVNIDVVKKDVYDAKIKHIEDKKPETSN